MHFSCHDRTRLDKGGFAASIIRQVGTKVAFIGIQIAAVIRSIEIDRPLASCRANAEQAAQILASQIIVVRR